MPLTTSAVFPSAHRRQELRALTALTLPILAGQLAQTGMGAVDTLMAGAVGAEDLAAVAVGSSFWVPVFLFLIGTLMATTANVAHLFGGNRLSEIAPMVRQSLWLALTLGTIAGLLLSHADRVLVYFMDGNPDLQRQVQIYLNGVAWGMPAIALYQTLRYFCEGKGNTRPAMCVAILGLLCNIPLNYLFIYGGLGIEPMGGAGCGWATGIVMWIMLITLATYVTLAPRYKDFELLRHWTAPKFEPIKDLLKLGVPIGIAIFMESSLFAIIALLLTPLGETVVASHQVTLNFSSLTFMLPLSVSMAITIRVGQSLGSGSAHEARYRALTGLILTLSCAAVNFSVMMFGGHQIADFYSNDLEVVTAASHLMIIAALFQFSDATQVSISGALRAYKDTRIPMVLTCLAYWCIGLPLGWTLAMTDTLTAAPLGATGFWLALFMGLTVAATLLAWRFTHVSSMAIRKEDARLQN
ncbi:MATE family efflux transporter [Pokkaliibacter sp. CJK22405]|uniref:MATE family efflux transporter n=1 Tax=Pokkaliibacter sp. CJK22405 TaxID=3384615 RepID=UPI0039850094